MPDDRIISAHDVYPQGSGAERVHETFWPLVHPTQPLRMPERMANVEAAVYVTINHSRWVIVCPDCGEGQVAARDDARFLCIRCLNIAVDGAWRPVAWPKNPSAIERELLRRPSELNRNWAPPETVETLRNELLSQSRPSVPRLEDLSKSDGKKLHELHDLRLYPSVEWEDGERTTPVVHWPTKKEIAAAAERSEQESHGVD